MKTKRWIIRGLLLALAWILAAAPASAHRVNIFAWVEGDQVHTESKFPGGRAVNGGVIRVLDASGKELLSGKTDDDGGFSFPIPQKSDLVIVLEAGMGHRNEWRLGADELGDAAAPAPAEAAEETAPPEEASASATPPQAVASVDAAALQAAVERALDKKLAPLQRSIAEMAEPEPGFREVMGGLGYIFGLLGLWAYATCRRKEKS